MQDTYLHNKIYQYISEHNGNTKDVQHIISTEYLGKGMVKVSQQPATENLQYHYFSQIRKSSARKIKSTRGDTYFSKTGYMELGQTPTIEKQIQARLEL